MKRYKYAFDKYQTLSEVLRTAKLHPKILKAAKLLAKEELAEMKARISQEK